VKTVFLLALAGLLLLPVAPARAQFLPSFGWFWQDMNNAQDQTEYCYDWLHETCLAEMMADIPNWGGLNNPTFCWEDGCRHLEHRPCNACEGTCEVGIDLPDWLGAKPNCVYFTAWFVEGVKEAMMVHDQWWTQDAEWQNGAPCYADYHPIPPGTRRVKGMYGLAATFPGWGSAPEPDWEGLKGAFQDHLKYDPLLAELAAGLVYVSQVSASEGNPLAMYQRLSVAHLAYLVLSGQWPLPPASPEEAPSVPSDFTAEEWWAIAYASAWVYVGEFTAADPVLVGFPSNEYPEAMIDLMTEILAETCGHFVDCDWVPVHPTSWGAIKTRYRKEKGQ
jgi:hypothetical protein